jgi:hypothetical protein
MKRILIRVASIFLMFTLTLTTAAYADEVTDWNEVMLRAALVAGTSPLNVTRVAAIVQAAVFDSVNGIEPRYAAVHVAPAAARGTSRRAAAIQAAYATLIKLYPAQQGIFDAQRTASLTNLFGDSHDSTSSIALGIEWGQKVADGILELRSTDGFTPAPPPFLGGLSVGMWRPTPPAMAPGAGPQFAYMKPWVMNSPSQFRPAGPPTLNSARYVADFNETKTMGSLTSPSRTADQTIAALFWNSATASYLWNSVARSLLRDRTGRMNDKSNERRNNRLLENARLFALLNLAMADAAIACWEAKYTYVFWRPVTAIPLADTDGNPSTTADPSWSPLFATPAHPEYPSGHSAVSGAAATVLEAIFGRNTQFHVRSDLMFGVVRSFRSFSAATEEVKDARIFAGIHFRSATTDGQTQGVAVASHVLGHALRPLPANQR